MDYVLAGMLMALAIWMDKQLKITSPPLYFLLGGMAMACALSGVAG